MIRSKRTVWMNLGLVGLLALTSACGKSPEEGKSKGDTSVPPGTSTPPGTVVKLPKKCSDLPLGECDSVLGCKKDGGKCGDDGDLSAEKCGEKSGDDCQKASYCKQNMFGQCFDIEGATTGECRIASTLNLETYCANISGDGITQPKCEASVNGQKLCRFFPAVQAVAAKCSSTYTSYANLCTSIGKTNEGAAIVTADHCAQIKVHNAAYDAAKIAICRGDGDNDNVCIPLADMAAFGATPKADCSARWDAAKVLAADGPGTAADLCESGSAITAGLNTLHLNGTPICRYTPAVLYQS